MDSPSDSEASGERMRRLSRKRVYLDEDEDMGFNHNKKKEAGERMRRFIRIRRSSRKRVYEDEDKDMGSNHNKKEKTGNLSRPVMCKGERNSTSCICALTRAQGVQTKLSPQFPSCVKLVTQLQVPGGKEQYLNLTRRFCHKHLPMDNVTVVFVDENEKEFSTGYRFINCRFRIGWRGFSIANRLFKGDALVFHLIGHCKFKVYIVRACVPTKVDGAIQNPSIDVPVETENGDQMAEGGRSVMAVKEECLDYLSEDSHLENIPQRTKSDRTPDPDRCESDNLCSDAIGGIGFSASAVKFQDVKRFEDFKIYVDGRIIDLELHLHAKVKYYELCCSQKMFLHDRLITGLGSKLVIGMISEMSDITDAIKSTSLTASLRNLETWDKTLKAFEDLGMSVGFLRTRIDKLVKISREYHTINQSKDAKFAQVEAKKSTLDMSQKSIAILKESIKSLEAEIHGIEGKNEELGFDFKEIAAASW